MEQLKNRNDNVSKFPDTFLKGLSDEQIAWLNDLPDIQLFTIICWGCAATKWLSKTLNSHPEIFCLHALNNKWFSTNKFASENVIDGIDYLYVIAKLADVYKAAGDVHGVSRHHVPELRRVLGDKFNAVVVVREPLPRLKSQISLFQYQKRQQYPKLWNVDYIDDVIKNKCVTLPNYDYEHKLFVHGVNMLNAITEEVNVGKIYRSEDLTTNQSMLGEFIEEITHGKVTTDNELLSKMVETDRVSRHKGKEIEFEDWQIDVIKKVVEEKSWELYSKLGYSKPNFL